MWKLLPFQEEKYLFSRCNLKGATSGTECRFLLLSWGPIKWHFVISEHAGVGPVPTEFSCCGQEEGEGLQSNFGGSKIYK